MSNRKNYNSIVFLTTLSVYLGLVLAGGATPSVLGQAATTRGFDIKSEIVVEDDLDKKPDDEKLDFPFALNGYFDVVEEFIEDLQKNHKKENFNFGSEEFEFERFFGISCNEGFDPVVNSHFISRVDNTRLEKVITSADFYFEDWETFSDCVATGNYLNSTKKYFTNSYKLKVFNDASQLKIELSVPKLTKQRADFLSERFNQTYQFHEVDEEDKIVKSIYKNTFINSENNQVFIVTRLPRASIDALLAENSAQ